ncbi:hypothetical protein PIB30_067262 [Stylosanthes scabra]|uniref:Uncharacterized protein n=1 Tax=Stylosanthes scabra TaxID=79078 RepID=A0ABU6UM03_9FABA|nr:hypothetical protein [Stylosanthes scabra]
MCPHSNLSTTRWQPLTPPSLTPIKARALFLPITLADLPIFRIGLPPSTLLLLAPNPYNTTHLKPATRPSIMHQGQHHTATVEEAATVEHVWNLINVARAQEFYGNSRSPRRHWTDRPDRVIRQLNIADRHPARKYLPLAYPFYFRTKTPTLMICITASQALLWSRNRTGAVRDMRRGSGLCIASCVACAPGHGLEVVSSAGRFSPDIQLAQEDGAASLTKALLDATQMTLNDFTSDLFVEAKTEITELRRELEEVKLKHATLTVKYMDLRGEFAPGVAPHSSDSDDN